MSTAATISSARPPWSMPRSRCRRSLLEHRLGPREERVDRVIEPHVVLRRRRRMRDARHHDEFLVGVWQQPEELEQVLVARDAVMLPAQDRGRDLDRLWI